MTGMTSMDIVRSRCPASSKLGRFKWEHMYHTSMKSKITTSNLMSGKSVESINRDGTISNSEENEHLSYQYNGKTRFGRIACTEEIDHLGVHN